MVEATKKLNLTIRNELAKELEEMVPRGKRSRVVNDATMVDGKHMTLILSFQNCLQDLKVYASTPLFP
jgi:hypothetical protein